MKRLKFLPSVLMLVLCVGVLCMGIYAASPNSNQITGSITINPANAAVDILYWAEKADGTQSTKIPLTDVRTGGQTINFNNKATFGEFLKLDFGSANNINEVKPCYIKIEITNNSSTKELGAYFSREEMTKSEAAKSDIFTTAPMTNSTAVTATSLEFYKHMGVASDTTSDTATLVLEFKANDFIESNSSISFDNYHVNIEEYNPNITTEIVTADQISAVNGFVKLSTSYMKSGAETPRTEITEATGFSGLKTPTDMWVVVPNGVEILEGGLRAVGDGSFTREGAFRHADALNKITLPNTLTEIKNDVFFGAGLTSIILPNSLNDIGEAAFGFSDLVTICLPNSINSIPLVCFSGCEDLTEVFGTNVLDVGNVAFSDCTSLKTISLETNATIGDRAFAGCSFNEVNYVLNNQSGFIFENGLLTITDMSVGYGSVVPLTLYISFPSGVTEIPADKFSGASSLKSVTIPNSVQSIGASAFEDCSSLSSVEIPSNVQSIGDRAFRNCGLTGSLIIPENVKIIGEYAFGFCEQLTEIIIPKSITSFGDHVFGECNGVSQITFKGSSSEFNARSDKYNILKNHPVYCEVDSVTIPKQSNPNGSGGAD